MRRTIGTVQARVFLIFAAIFPFLARRHSGTVPLLDLQRFAETQTTLLPALSDEMKTYYEQRLIDHAEPNLVHIQFGDKYPIPKRSGKKIEFRKYAPLAKALTPLTEGVTPQGNKLSVSILTSEIKQYGDFIETSDLLDLTAIDPNVEQATRLLGSQAGRTLDTVVREVLNGGTNVSYAPKINASTGAATEVFLRKDIDPTCALTPDVILTAAGKLKRMNATPYDRYFVAIIHTDTATDLQKNKDFQEWQKYTTSDKMFEGELGKMGRVRFVESTEAKIIGPAFIFGNAGSGGICRMTLKTALNSTGSTTIAVNEEITAAQAAEFTARRTAGETIKFYIGGKEATILSCTAGAAGAATFTASAVVQSVDAGAMVCGTGAGKDGSAVYCTLFLGASAYGVTEVEGGGLEHIIKQLGSAGTADALNQRATTGWKATETAERLVEEYMLRVEHGCPTFSATAESN